MCTCPDIFIGNLCQNVVNTCDLDKPCENDARCYNLANDDQFRCICPMGYTGKDCSIDIDECGIEGLNQCRADGTLACVDLVNAYECKCEDGFFGVFCEQDFQECESAPCGRGGWCVDGVNSYSCECAPGWSGDNCGVNVDECESNPCLHSGTCQDLEHGFNSVCANSLGRSAVSGILGVIPVTRPMSDPPDGRTFIFDRFFKKTNIRGVSR